MTQWDNRRAGPDSQKARHNLFFLGWAFFGALAFFLGSANPLIHIPLFIALYPGSLYVLGLGSPRPFRHGWLCGSLGAAGGLYWIAVAVHDYGYFPWVAAAPCALLLGMYIGLWGGLYSWCIRRMQGLSPLRRIFGAALLWFLLEWARSWFLSGFPWLTLASGQGAWPVLVQGASIIGEYGVSAWLAVMGILLLESLRWVPSGSALSHASSRKSCTACITLLSLLLTTLIAFGAWNLNRPPAENGTPVHMALIQGNMPQDVKWDAAFKQATVNRYLDLSWETLVLEDRQPEILIWPETAMPFFYHNSPDYTEQIRQFAQRENIPLLFGSPDMEREPGQKGRIYNRAIFLDAEGKYRGHYEKQHLVPFGEYVPPLFDNPLFATLLQEAGNFTPGSESPPFTFEARNGTAHLGMLICYEAIFPEIARARVTQGANILINISNDAWYNFTSAPVQHLYLSQLRAVEQGRWLARGTNTGVSAFIDPQGRIYSLGGITDGSGLFISGHLAREVYAIKEYTIYYYLQPWLPTLAIALFMFIVWPMAQAVIRLRTCNENAEKPPAGE